MAVLQEVFLSGSFEGVDNEDEFGFDADHVGQGSGHDWQTCAALWGYVLCRPTSWNVYSTIRAGYTLGEYPEE